eukprot:192488_1
MSTSESWMGLTACPCINRLIVPDGTDINNYIVMDVTWTEISYIYNYNTDTDKWNKIDGCNNIQLQNMSEFKWFSRDFSAALDVKKHLLFLSNRNYVVQIQLNSGN